jgi:four helix bundle protein
MSKQYDLEERTFQFAENVSLYIKEFSRTISNIEYGKQVVRSSGSVGANYIEANEALSKKDFIMRIKICRKETKESAYWLRLIVETNSEKYTENGTKLFKESTELKRYFLLSLKVKVVNFVNCNL